MVSKSVFCPYYLEFFDDWFRLSILVYWSSVPVALIVRNSNVEAIDRARMHLTNQCSGRCTRCRFVCMVAGSHFCTQIAPAYNAADWGVKLKIRIVKGQKLKATRYGRLSWVFFCSDYCPPRIVEVRRWNFVIVWKPIFVTHCAVVCIHLPTRFWAVKCCYIFNYDCPWYSKWVRWFRWITKRAL